jgi:hypothetical protein
VRPVCGRHICDYSELDDILQSADGDGNIVTGAQMPPLLVMRHSGQLTTPPRVRDTNMTNVVCMVQFRWEGF